jgi:uncharacterized protein DUF4824
MKLSWSRMHTLAAGMALVALTNAVALGGVAWNRSGAPESELKLSQRELWDVYGGRYDRESGGSELMLRWRVLSQEYPPGYYDSHSGALEWLDEAKLAALGFDVSKQLDPARESRRYRRLLPREALIVLELDGPASQKALERARERLAQETAKESAGKDKKDMNRVKMAAEALKHEETSSSRLFAVDAGPDAAALRAKYPDRGRYAIVRGKIRAYPPAAGAREKDRRWRGYLESLDSPRINLPLEFREAAGLAMRALPAPGRVAAGTRFEVTVAFGKRFEPWVTAVAVTK